MKRIALRAMLLAALAIAPCAHGREFRVRDFGAKGDGTSPDTNAIQSALEAAARAGGGTVVLTPGTYLSGIPVHIVMNWNPQYSYARIPPGMTNIPSTWKVLATPVPPKEGLAHFRNLRIWNVAATGARRAFDVNASPDAPLENFSFDHITISALSAGRVADTKGWTLANVSIRAADGSRLTFADIRGLKLKDDTGIAAAPEGANR